MGDALDGDLAPVAHVVEHEDHRARGEPAELGIALDECDLGAVARRRHRGGETCRPTADDDDVGLMHCVCHRCHPISGDHFTTRRSSQEMATVNSTEKMHAAVIAA